MQIVFETVCISSSRRRGSCQTTQSKAWRMLTSRLGFRAPIATLASRSFRYARRASGGGARAYCTVARAWRARRRLAAAPTSPVADGDRMPNDVG